MYNVLIDQGIAKISEKTLGAHNYVTKIYHRCLSLIDNEGGRAETVRWRGAYSYKVTD